ncbi:hypothetical protein U4E84_04425 [Halorubrum sp. AD140]|uniref:hypothetical protein n=1 Tax=Halorubrum sp. AD140 TaxID=3050073 RepID=UPI002ACCF02C|nr:hypothetical protein [Halorubrum sp. AD140]MDZ5810593.1 hypothetical protein [Halorubrum sp. AD140]
MTDSSITLLEVHLGDGDIEIGPFELFGATDEPVTVSELEGEVDTDEDADGRSARLVAGVVLALAALAAVAVGVAKLRSGDEAPSGVDGDG